MSIFQSILDAAAQPTAPAVVSAGVAAVGFDGTRTTPSVGFTLPVVPATKSLYDYQLAAVETILASRRVLLGLQPGLGKTAIMQASVAVEAQVGRRSLVVVPPSLRISPWAQDFAADYPGLRVALVAGTKPEAFPTNVDVVIIPDSIVFTKRMDDILAWAPDNIFVDEAHHFKTRGAQRTKSLIALCDTLPADSIICGATGTLVSNKLIDVYSQLRATGAANAKAVSGGPSWSTFMDSWCETEMVMTRSGRIIKTATKCRDEEGLRAALVNSCYISVPREEVLDLPPRTTAVRSMVVNGDATAYRRIEKQFISWIRETRGDAAAQRAMKAEALTKLMALWEQDGLAKVNATADYVNDMIEQGEQVVVMAHHRSVLTGLYEAFLKAGHRVGVIIGGMSSEAKADIVGAFQAGQLDIVLGNIIAAGTGLTLHAARHLVFAQLPWAPGVYGQAADRIYRIGQTRHVTTHVLNLNEGVSEHLWVELAKKARVADAINTGTPSTIDGASVEEAVLRSYGW